MEKKPETWAKYLDTETRSAPGLGRQVSELRAAGLTILCHPDLRRIGERIALPELGSDKEVLLSRTEPLFAAPEEALRRPLGDPYLSRDPIRLRPGAAGGARLDCGGTRTSVFADGERVDGERQLSASDLERGVVLLLAERVALLLHLQHPSPLQGVPRFDMVGDSPGLLRVRREIEQLAALRFPVLLRGETGTGKELVASALHQAGPRRSGPYLAVNLGAVPASLAAAELFGASRGAFTGAERRRLGYFSRADGGTLFLDELGEMPAEVQGLLLRTLESGEIQPVGAEEPRKVDVRVIAATDTDLEAKIAAGTFRAPLLHRLASYEIRLPPLRERRDDVGRLFVHFLHQELGAVGRGERLTDPGRDARPWLPAPLVARLAVCSWPGNVRQLRNVARQLVAACRDDDEARWTPQIERLLLEDDASGSVADRPRSRKSFRPADEVGEEELLAALAANRWRLQPTAAELGVSRTSLYRRIEASSKVRKPRDLRREEIERAIERCGGNMNAMIDELRVSRKGLRRRMTELKLS